MPSIKRLKSVAQSTAHHATSGLSFIHPHLGEECLKSGKNEIIINLKSKNPCPEQFQNNKELLSSLYELQKRFFDICKLEGFSAEEIKMITLQFNFNNHKDPKWCSICKSTIVSNDNKEFSYTVDWVGKTITNKQYVPTY